ncbi:protein-lysine N-methyltransferase EEF2KMT-like [Daphnia pulicaria]|uniref:protein-lysine N-methyltransferase EEF2KMT-like n=1 Tax=Daphnia pulicaria TaxID=35523 RepID=UPI001EEB8242|nr:protein-lysine N-methyltransferase EEF2KMT-like [Daphnia pulicaria]XP_046637124.1 protein-lysine N-methyltransferase EEF2KMT-like [Daphnia pulicaria]
MFDQFTKSFLARIPVSKLDWKFIEETLNQSSELGRVNGNEDEMFLCQESILNATVHHPLNLKYPLPDVYIHTFLKCLINMVERFHCEIHSNILEKYTNLICKNLSTVEAGHRSFMIDESTSISLRENISIISDGTTGLCTWQAAFHLAEWCIANRQRITGMTVVELGSGAGLVGLTCYKTCKPGYITMTDFHPKVMETLRYNLENNQLIENSSPPIDIQPLDWMEFHTKSESSLQADLVLASDVVFDVELIPALVGTLSKLLHPRDNQLLPSAIVACTERNQETLNRFLYELAQQNLTYGHLEHAPSIFACERNYPVRIYEIQSIKC